MALGTPTWLPVFASLRPGVITRPVRRVSCAPAPQSGTAVQSAQFGSAPAAQTVGPSMPPTQSWLGPHVSPSSSQTTTLPHMSTVSPQAQPSCAQVVRGQLPASPKSMYPPEPPPGMGPLPPLAPPDAPPPEEPAFPDAPPPIKEPSSEPPSQAATNATSAEPIRR